MKMVSPVACGPFPQTSNLLNLFAEKVQQIGNLSKGTTGSREWPLACLGVALPCMPDPSSISLQASRWLHRIHQRATVLCPLSVGGLRAESWERTCSLRSLRLIAMLSPGMNQTVAIEYLGEGALGAPLMNPTTLRLET